MEIIFKQISHIKKSQLKENPYIKRILAGETYVPNYLEVYPKEDKTSFFKRKCVAKYDRWQSGSDVYSTEEEVVNDWGGRVMYDKAKDKWYYRAMIEIHFLDGETYSSYFDSDEEMEKDVEKIIRNCSEENWQSIKSNNH